MSNKTKKIALLISLAVILTATVGTTVAYLAVNGGSISNIFNPTKVGCTVNNADYTVKNDGGDIDVYIRAKVLVNWVADNGATVYGTKPTADEYTLTMNTAKWKEYGTDEEKYWYYPVKVADGASTEALISSFTPTKQTLTKEGVTYELTVQIIAESIQADGVTGNTPAVVDAWGVDPSALN